jgi:DNA-binding transcriptional ArsR family regulator
MRLDLERVLASSCRTRIIRLLYKKGHVHVMQLVHQANSTYNEVNSHLRILQKEGIILDEHFGRLRVIRLSLENPRTLILLEALRILKAGENKNHCKANGTKRSRDS